MPQNWSWERLPSKGVNSGNDYEICNLGFILASFDYTLKIDKFQILRKFCYFLFLFTILEIDI